MPSGSSAQENLIEIKKDSRRAAALIEQMLAYSGRGRFEVSRIDLSRVVVEMVPLMRASLSKNVTVACELPEEPLLLEAGMESWWAEGLAELRELQARVRAFVAESRP